MRLALDYDDTYTLDPELWNAFALAARQRGHDVRIVTARCAIRDNVDDRIGDLPVIYCNGVAKRFYCREFADWVPDVFIDDKPENVGNNSTASPEWLANWRLTRDH